MCLTFSGVIITRKGGLCWTSRWVRGKCDGAISWQMRTKSWQVVEREKNVGRWKWLGSFHGRVRWLLAAVVAEVVVVWSWKRFWRTCNGEMRGAYKIFCQQMQESDLIGRPTCRCHYNIKLDHEELGAWVWTDLNNEPRTAFKCCKLGNILRHLHVPQK